MTALTGKVGFTSPQSEKVLSRKRTLGVELIATAALALSLIVAATAVSFGVARAQPFKVTRLAGAGCFTRSATVPCASRIRIPALRSDPGHEQL